jgi:hypothetical protein
MTRPVYLDVCSLCRPFDDQSFIRVRLETEAVNLILVNVHMKRYSLLVSSVHFLELSSISDLSERVQIEKLLQLEGRTIKGDLVRVQNRTTDLMDQGFGVADAAHVAFAESQNADFISCDDRLVLRCIKHKISVWAGTPVAFCDKENLQ